MSKITWTPELDAKLIELKQSGMSWNDISEIFGATKGAVENRYWKIRKNLANPKPSEEAAPVMVVQIKPEIKPAEHTPQQDKTPMISSIYDMIVSLAKVAGFAIEHIEINRFDSSWFASAAGIGNNGDQIKLELTRDGARATE